MRIVLATPLYPPEIAESAPYVKELANRLSKSHAVTVVAYARLPEQVPGVRIIAVNKRRPLPLRLLSYFFTLLGQARDADVLYVLNGASVELPAALVAFLTGRPLVFHIGDLPAHERASRSQILGAIERFAFTHAAKIVADAPLPRPEILPLEPYPAEAFSAYEGSWKKHLGALEKIFSYVV